jgi:hypothetical protein
MAELSVEAAIGLVSGSLLEKLCGNTDLVNAVMALMGKLCQTMGALQAKSVRIGPIRFNGRAMVAKLHIIKNGIPPPMPHDLPGKKTLLETIGSENEAFYYFIKAHPDITDWLREVIQKMETYALAKGRRYDSLRFATQVIDHNSNIVLELEP